jgi:signal-transduction protein with cAMP-binding, CBS, and nucleotidyltransferase domain
MVRRDRKNWQDDPRHGLSAPSSVEASMKNVAYILRSKSDQTIHTVAPSATMFEALKLMAEKNIGALLVVEGERVVGIVSERDYARKIVLAGRTSRDTMIRDIMTSPVMYVDPHQSTDECMALMTQNRLRHLPVLEDGKLVGIISIGDLVKDIISEQHFMIQELQRYITGVPG